MAVTKVTTKVLADDAVTIDKIADAALVTESEGISSNDNDTTIPTSAAVKDYVDTQDATKEDTITGAATTITDTDLTASKALISNASGKVAASAVTDTELGYVSGVTSSIQDQFDNLTDNNTTYTVSAADGDNADEEKIVLTGSDATTDTIVLEAGTGLSIARTGDKITFTNTVTDTDTVLTTEQVEDIVGAMVSSNTETGITVTYDDTNGKIDFAVASQTDENFTSALKTKLDGIAAGAEVNQNSFSTIAVSGQTSVNADSNTDTLNLAAGTGITLTTDAGSDTVTITSTATGSVTEAFKTISVSGQSDVVADGATDTLTLAAGSNITLTTDAATDTITIASTASGGGGGISWVATPKTANFPATAGEGYFVNTTSAAITVTLPSSPTAGDEVSIVDYAGTADTNNIIITSSDNINGASDDVEIDYERGGVSMVYVDSTQGWIAYNAANETAEALVLDVPLTVDYLVVAGGGGSGGISGAAGAAGGLRTSYGSTTGGGGSAESTLTLNKSTNYTVTVGGGGAGWTGSNPTNGIDSTFSTITATGGGTGGASGGSGGGAVANSGNGAAAVTSPVVQGYAGGNSTYTTGGGGGGGAGSVGGNAGSATGGNGGSGLVVNILNSTNSSTASVGDVSGSDVYYASGGGGGGSTSGGTASLGGGGNGGYSTVNGLPGDSNTGGGSGSGWSAYDSTTQGGSGVVILRYPSSYSITVGSGIIEASGSPFTEGSDKVSVFTGGTGNILFS